MAPPTTTSTTSLADVPPPLALEGIEGRVVVAMSGGVDSSVVAALLAERNHDLVGISMRLYATAVEGRSCCSPDDLYDAREVADAAGFPFYVANYQEEFKARVIDHFVDEYRRGRTPSPCVLCNDHLKFDILLQRMLALGGRHLATGHYARVERVDTTGESPRWALLRGVDGAKDQSYFLFGLRRSVLQHLLFPLGALTKAQVRMLAIERGLPVANKPESQDICFVGNRSYTEFLEARLGEAERRPGPIVRRSTGEVLGHHDGIHRYTIGQRRGLGVASEQPLYVRSVDADTGTVWVGTAEEISERSFDAERANWLRWETPPARFRCAVQVRSRQQPIPATVTVDSSTPDRFRVELDADERGISPGQAAVLYDGDEVLGGGWIECVG
jgi:tRNA-specific 2-thiouridylase